jgi:hypothetical protein
MLSAIYAECLYAECRYAECLYAECLYAECHYAECRCAKLRHFRICIKFSLAFPKKESFASLQITLFGQNLT